jgi:hypothetical protein
MNKIVLFFLVIVSFSVSAKVVQDEQIWANMNAFINLKDNWQVYLEAQPRMIDDSSKNGTILYRGAVGKNLQHGFSAWLGYGFIEKVNPTYLHEDRPFVQLIHGKDLNDNIRLINRTRFEGRYFRGGTRPAFRLRHLMRVQYRFSGSRFGLVAFDEWFWNPSSTPSAGVREGFDQNRVFFGLSYAFGEKAQHLGEIGYMNHYVNVYIPFLRSLSFGDEKLCTFNCFTL